MLFEYDAGLLRRGVAERAIVAKLASYLAPLFRTYDVDVEYNRHGLDVKRLNLPISCRGGGRKRVYPDIVVHGRGHDEANLLAIEVKKRSNREPRTCDCAKIEAMKAQFKYEVGVLLDLPTHNVAAKPQAIETWL